MVNHTNRRGKYGKQGNNYHKPLRDHNEESRIETPLRAALAALAGESLGYSGPETTLRVWGNGSRTAPQWFRQLLADKLREKRAAIDRALADLDVGPRRGKASGLRGYWRDRREREASERFKAARIDERRRITSGAPDAGK
jgi:hypothetical protein